MIRNYWLLKVAKHYYIAAPSHSCGHTRRGENTHLKVNRY